MLSKCDRVARFRGLIVHSSVNPRDEFVHRFFATATSRTRKPQTNVRDTRYSPRTDRGLCARAPPRCVVDGENRRSRAKTGLDFVLVAARDPGPPRRRPESDCPKRRPAVVSSSSSYGHRDDDIMALPVRRSPSTARAELGPCSRPCIVTGLRGGRRTQARLGFCLRSRWLFSTARRQAGDHRTTGQAGDVQAKRPPPLPTADLPASAGTRTANASASLAARCCTTTRALCSHVAWCRSFQGDVPASCRRTRATPARRPLETAPVALLGRDEVSRSHAGGQIRWKRRRKDLPWEPLRGERGIGGRVRSVAIVPIPARGPVHPWRPRPWTPESCTYAPTLCRSPSDRWPQCLLG